MSSNKWVKCAFIGLIVLAVLYALLLIPVPEAQITAPEGREAFAWNQDQYWSALEAKFKAAKSAGCANESGVIGAGLTRLNLLVGRVETGSLKPESSIFDTIETALFELVPPMAACPERLQDYISSFRRLRTALKNQSQEWNLNEKATRDRMYRLLYGGRIAVEEMMLQSRREVLASLVQGTSEPSKTPRAVILGVPIYSGDILISRGGAPTSALIARGNDYPGNFSHVALVYIDEQKKVSLIESHIEKGVAVASIDDYLKDTKLRVMVLRLRADLPVMVADPMLPHRAASYALERAKAGHIAYDFAMDFEDPTKLFCSEVVSDAYKHVGINLWMGMSHISTVGVKSWLGAFGVRTFETQEPSDLEYDPQLRVVAEWRDYETLLKDRLDNAVVDVMLESAEGGARLTYDWYMLPFARVMKGYSVMLNLAGIIGPIPEGIDATAALKHDFFAKWHEKIKQSAQKLIDKFTKEQGYTPPYWELVKLARQSRDLEASKSP